MMVFRAEEDLANRRMVYTLTISDDEMERLKLDHRQREALRWLAQQNDIESKLMGLQIIVRSTEDDRQAADQPERPENISIRPELEDQEMFRPCSAGDIAESSTPSKG